MDNGPITRAALGSCAALGDLYDARKDDFCGISILKKSIPACTITLRDKHSSDIHLVHSDDFSEKSSKMDIGASLQVSVLAGLFTLEGSGRYLSDQKKSARTVRSSLIYKIETKTEALNIYHEDLKDAFAIDAIESGIATHVVAGISWGANSIVTCTYENKENRDVRDISGSLSAQLKMVALSISGKASVDIAEGDKENGIKFDVRMFGDILAQDHELPTTPEEAIVLMKKMPSLVATSNEGRGKPLSYKLIPLSLLQKYLNFAKMADGMLQKLEETSLIRAVQLFDQMSAAQQKLNDFYQDALDYKYCVRPEYMVTISNLKNDMAIQETSFRSELSSILVDIRSGKSEVEDLENLFKKFQSSDVSPQNVSKVLDTWSDLTEKIDFAKALVEGGAKYIGLRGSLDKEILKDFDAKSFVLFFTQEAKSKEPGEWIGNRQLFFQQMKKKLDGDKYYVVDCDIHPTLMIDGHSSCIQVLQNGKVIINDLLKEQEETKHISLVQAISGTERLLQKPKIRVPLTIPCGGNNCDPSKSYDWTCKKCKDKIDYGYDNHVYCKCGKTPAVFLEFKCSDPNHGVAFELYNNDFLLKVLGTFVPPSANNKFPGTIQPIPETNLFTGTYYTLGLKPYPSGWVTYTNNKGEWKYVIIDARAKYTANYQKSGRWYNDTQWFFTPSETEPSWYHLRNRGLPEHLATWSKSETTAQAYGRHIILNRNADPTDPDTLWKPVQQPIVDNLLSSWSGYFQLRIKSLPAPQGVVTWSAKQYGGPDARYIQVDNNNPGHKGNYEVGGKWFEDILFRFEHFY